MKAIIYQYDDAPITLEDIESPIVIEGDDISIRNYEGLQVVNIDEVQEVRIVSK